MPGASLALFADWGACHVQKSSVTICVLPAPSGWRATLRAFNSDCDSVIISIHALRVEGDKTAQTASSVSEISIHAPRVEGDRGPRAGVDRRRDFYPRPPGGGRRICSAVSFRVERFLSTPSGWRATSAVTSPVRSCSSAISIHALRVEGDYLVL